MLKSILKIYFRNLLKNRLFILINVLGLSVGITACMLVYNYVEFHRSFDRSYKRAEDVYRIVTETYVDGRLSDTYGVTMQFIGPQMKTFPEVEECTRMLACETMLLYKDNEIVDRLGIWGVDSNFIDFFGLKMQSGNGSKALIGPNTAVLTASAAKRIFGAVNPLGKTVGLGYGVFHEPFPFQVMGVVQDPPVNSHIKFDVLITAVDPTSIIGKLMIFGGGDPTYFYPFFDTYVRLKKDASPRSLEAKFPAFLDNRIKGIMEKYGKRRLFLQPLTDVHLGPKYKWGIEMITNKGMRANESSEFTIRWVSFFALILLGFSIFNFINLSLINYSKRGKELSMKKHLGAKPGDFLLQFFIEAAILTGISAIISIILLICFKGAYYRYLGLPAGYSVFDHAGTYLFLALLFWAILSLKVLFVFLMSSLLKLFYSNRKSREVPFARYLVILQFMGAFVMVDIAIVLHKQLHYMLSKDLGYTTDNILTVEKYTMGSGTSSISLDHLEAFRQELLKNSYVKGVCLSSVTPGYYHHSNQIVWAIPDRKVESNTIWVDKDYASVYGLKLLAGRGLSDPKKDEIMINESLMKAIGVSNPDSLVGKYLYIDEAMSHHFKPGATRIAGVLRDFYQEPLSKTVAPAKFHYVDGNRGYYSIRYAAGHGRDVIDYVKRIFPVFYPKDNFNYAFLNEFIDSQYKSDTQFKELMNITTGLSLLIACLGVLGLITYSVEVQRKATAVRKILGSSLRNLVFLFLKKYLIYYTIAIIISFPIAILLIRSVLNNYAYRTEISYLLLFFPALIILALISAIIGTQVLKAGREKPIIALKAE